MSDYGAHCTGCTVVIKYKVYIILQKKMFVFLNHRHTILKTGICIVDSGKIKHRMCLNLLCLHFVSPTASFGVLIGALLGTHRPQKRRVRRADEAKTFLGSEGLADK